MAALRSVKPLMLNPAQRRFRWLTDDKILGEAKLAGTRPAFDVIAKVPRKDPATGEAKTPAESDAGAARRAGYAKKGQGRFPRGR